MADIVNLRSVRKREKRRQLEQAAAANRLAHGARKGERTREHASREKATHDLDGHRITTGDGE